GISPSHGRCDAVAPVTSAIRCTAPCARRSSTARSIRESRSITSSAWSPRRAPSCEACRTTRSATSIKSARSSRRWRCGWPAHTYNRASSRPSSHAEVRALGDEFHRYLVKRADNTKLLQVLEQMREEVQPVWTMSIAAPGRAQALVREHLAIIDALTRADVRRAERLMRRRIRRVRDAIFRLVD